MDDSADVATKRALQPGNVIRVKHRALRILAALYDYDQLDGSTHNQWFLVQHISEHDVTFELRGVQLELMLKHGASVEDSNGTQIFPRHHYSEKS